MARFKTFVNGGSVLPGDLDAMEDDYECAFGVYKHLAERPGVIAGGTAAGLWALGPIAPASSLNTDPRNGFSLDPGTDYWLAASTATVNARTVYGRLTGFYNTNGTSVGTVTFTVGLYPLASTTAGVWTMSATAIAGSTVVISNPTVNNSVPFTGSDFTFASSVFVIAVSTSAATAASSSITFNAFLQMRQK